MSGPDLHPEELLDKAAAGTLNDSERVWLEQHVAQCTVCRFEQLARADFAAAAAPVAAVQVDDLVARALAGMPTRSGGFGAPRRGSMRFLAAAAVALFAVGSFAAVWTGALPRLVVQLVSPAPAPTPVAPRRVAPEPAPAPAPPPVEAVVEQPAEPVPDAVPAPAPAPVVRRPVAVPVPVPVPAERGPSVLFSDANAARVRGDRAEAVLRYSELLRRFPSSDEARLTHAMLGRMLLDSGDSRAALVELDAYLALGDDTLREEAMSARARALALLGRTGDEAAAWQALLQQYPESVHAERASARLRELGAK